MSKLKKFLFFLVVAACVFAYFQSSESTRRYVKHLAKQIPYLPYRYFI